MASWAEVCFCFVALPPLHDSPAWSVAKCDIAGGPTGEGVLLRHTRNGVAGEIAL
jgi:hypothetical protein